MAVMFEVMQITIPRKKIRPDLIWIELVKENPNTPPFEWLILDANWDKEESLSKKRNYQPKNSFIES